MRITTFRYTHTVLPLEHTFTTGAPLLSCVASHHVALSSSNTEQDEFYARISPEEQPVESNGCGILFQALLPSVAGAE